MALIKVSVAAFQRNIGRYQDLALSGRAVVVTRKTRKSTVLISGEEYERLKRCDRRVFGLADFTAADVAALEASRPAAETRAFDDELKR